MVMAAGEQYSRLAINFVSIAITSRLLSPGEVGISIIGTGIMLITLGLREFATSDFLVQRQEVARRMSGLRSRSSSDHRADHPAMFVLAPWFGSFYGEEKLALSAGGRNRWPDRGLIIADPRIAAARNGLRHAWRPSIRPQLR